MVLIAASLSLLIIYAGTKLLMKTKKEMLNHFFKFISWFIITGGFVLLLYSMILICKRNCGNYKHASFNESNRVETCDHACVKKPSVDSIHFKSKNVLSGSTNIKGACEFCTCCNENSVQGPWCCKKGSDCCNGHDIDNGRLRNDSIDKNDKR